MAEPTIASAQALMKHPGIRIVTVTGGGEVVRQAMTCGKRAIAAGPGNPPVVVDETAHLPRAAEGIVKGASFDNNVICTDEKEVIVVADVADKLKRELERQPALPVQPGDHGPREGHPRQGWPREPRVRAERQRDPREIGLSAPDCCGCSCEVESRVRSTGS
jgi:acyl-CoA reductase-like NAD-dependent aldehyde dehydrogenase